MTSGLKIFQVVAGLAVLALFFGVCFLTTVHSGVIDWSSQRAVVLESDDWGLAGFVPSANVWHGHNRDDLVPGKFPAVYWGSTLEDSLMVADLCQIMASAQGADGLSAVFQPNYVMSSLSYESSEAGWVWQRYNLPHFPPTYPRPGMWSAVKQGIDQGLWYPEFHATWHYDPTMRLQKALETDFARGLTQAGVMLFPGSEKARELGSWRSLADLSYELLESQQIFEHVFQRPVGSVIAPDYTWNDKVEDMWERHGVKVIQGKREQRDPTLGPGKWGRGLKYIKKQWALVGQRQRTYLERNCRLEPVQAPDPDSIVQTCLQDTRNAWKRSQPAVVETHRVNFVHDDPAIVQTGQNSMQKYLDELCNSPDNLPTFMVDTEIAQLQSRGVSWVIRGENLIMRNGSHSRRLVVVQHQNTEKWFLLGPESVSNIPW